MITTKKPSGKSAFLPAGAKAFARRRLVELGGVLVLGGGFFVALALASANPADPSLNTVGVGPAVNWMGMAGSYVADFLWQTLGLGGGALALVLACWGWRLLRHHGLPHFWMNLAALPLALAALAMAASAFGSADAGPIGAGYGGAGGALLMRAALNGLALAGLSAPVWPIAIIAGLIGVAATVVALGLDREQWRALGRGLCWAGRQPGALIGRWRAATPADPGKKPEKKPAARKPRPATTPAGRVKKPPKRLRTGKRARAEAEPTLALEPADDRFRLPPLAMLARPGRGERATKLNAEALEQNARLLESVLDDFGVRGEILNVRPGPVITLYELEPAPGTKSSRVISLADDIARSMSAISARVAVVPGRNVIGIELPNARRETVYLREILSTPEYERATARLALTLGKDIGGAPIITDLAAMPHLLIAGTTGSGKSVAINTMILSLLYRLTPRQCRFIMIDPKMLELSVYEAIPHLLTPVVTDPKKAVVALKWAVREMEDRYKAMAKLGVRNLAAYNARVQKAVDRGEVLKRTVQTGFDRESGRPVYEEQELDLKVLPLIVIVVDEMADLMMVAGKDVEGSIQRLAQMARAAGLHLIMATQRPSVDVITGTIKANFPTRISFQVTTKIDSRTILGEQGAEQLLGQGDMLYMAAGGRITRIHGPFVSDGEVEEVVHFLKAQAAPDYLEEVTVEPEGGFDDPFAPASSGDDLYDQAVALVASEGKASTSFVQRHLQIGYNRAARIIEKMEKEGIIGPANHVGKREVLVGDHSAAG